MNLGPLGWLKREDVLISNPANTSQCIAIWFYATHQLKNMQNALLRSEGKTNQGFMKGGAAITWLIIIEAYKRELLKNVPISNLMTHGAISRR